VHGHNKICPVLTGLLLAIDLDFGMGVSIVQSPDQDVQSRKGGYRYAKSLTLFDRRTEDDLGLVHLSYCASSVPKLPLLKLPKPPQVNQGCPSGPKSTDNYARPIAH
jgi:hypothetical protein